METKELKITIPENHEIDWQESARQERIIFKKKDTKPRSWEEYCEQQNINDKKGYQINDASCDISEVCWRMYSRIDYWRNVLPSKELAEAFLAMMQLMSLRQAWIGDWKAYPGAIAITRSCDNRIIAWKDPERCLRLPLSFPTEEMAIDFMNCFKDLLKIAEPLL